MSSALRVFSRATRGVLWCVLGLVLLAGTAAALDPPREVTYSATVTIPVPPASSYAGSAGGDGWAVALTPTSVYNVFHHSGALQVACHLQSDASPCGATKTITDGAGGGFATGSHTGLTIDPASGHLYVYATRTQDATGGVVCIDTTLPQSTPNPFCGFTALTAAGDAPTNGGISAISSAVRTGSRWYAFNFVSGSPVTGTRNKLLCFDVSAGAACNAQPYAVDLGGATMSAAAFPDPTTALVADRVLVPYNSNQLACFDTAGGGPCGGVWPIALPSSYVSANGAAFPRLDADGTITGLCLPTGSDPCYSLAGASVATPSGMTAAITGSSPYNGSAFVLGPRVYVPNGNANQVQCFNYATSSSCVNFPKGFNALAYLYTVNADPQRPTCIWVNADGGAQQIQSFDAYTGGACGQGAIRVLASSMVVPTQACLPASYTSLQVLDPIRSGYASGTIAFQDNDANPIPGLPDSAIDDAGLVDLRSLNLSTQHGLPQFVITLTGPQGAPRAVTVKLTWTGQEDPTCVNPGTVVITPEPTPNPTPVPVVVAQPRTVTPAEVPQITSACSRRKLSLLNVLEHGKRVALYGVADKGLIGQTVTIRYAGEKAVATARVKSDGSFSATAPLPRKADLGTNTARYVAYAGQERSLDLKLTRRVIVLPPVVRTGKVTLRGTVTAPFTHPRSPITVTQQLTCGGKVTVVARVRPSASGAFRVTLSAPAGAKAALYRVATSVQRTVTNRKRFPTFGLPQAVELR